MQLRTDSGIQLKKVSNLDSKASSAVLFQMEKFPMLAPPGLLIMNESALNGQRTSDCFEKLDLLGEGTYGKVYKARDKVTGEIVAMKKIRLDKETEGFPVTAIREIRILKNLKHPNIVNLKEVVSSKGIDPAKKRGSVYMVFEYMDHDLTALIERERKSFTTSQVKCYMQQLLKGIHYLHRKEVLHRDLKASNLLLSSDGILKIADFGLSKAYDEDDEDFPLTNTVITLWYRPPELLLGSRQYGPAVDIWSAGCIFAELLTGKALFPGKDEIDQLSHIFNVCGAPDEYFWPGVSKLPHFQQFKREFKRTFREKFAGCDPLAVNLLEKMLTLNPSKRVSAKECLDSHYFWQEPLPAVPNSLPKYNSAHELDIKRKRKEEDGGQEKKRKLEESNKDGEEVIKLFSGPEDSGENDEAGAGFLLPCDGYGSEEFSWDILEPSDYDYALVGLMAEFEAKQQKKDAGEASNGENEKMVSNDESDNDSGYSPDCDLNPDIGSDWDSDMGPDFVLGLSPHSDYGEESDYDSGENHEVPTGEPGKVPENEPEAEEEQEDICPLQKEETNGKAPECSGSE